MIFERLKQERKRLGLNQDAFAGVAGVSRRAYAEWESDKSATSPTAVQLAAMATAGADVRYIITGEREGPPPVTLTADERVLLDGYRALDPSTCKRVLAFILGGEPTGSGKVIIHGQVGQQVEKIEGGVKIDMRSKK